MAVLSAQSVSVQYGETSSPLKFPDIEINAGEKVLLLGQSGCGKTSLLSVIAGLLTPSSGHIFVNGTDIFSLTTQQRDRLRGQIFGFVFQTLHLLPSLTIAQNIQLASDMAKLPSTQGRLEKLLSSLGLTELADRKPSELSQGQQQRAALARALYNFPALIIADEPTSSLDDENAKLVMNLLEQQAKESGSALLVATHDHRITHHFDKVIQLS
jgi:putative ABC transport system ATP-binding protein